MKTPSGNSFNGININTYVEIGPIFPRGINITNLFTRILILSRDAREYNVKYKLFKNVSNIDQEWKVLGTIDNEMTELEFDGDDKGVGIMIRIDSFGIRENNAQIYQIKIGSSIENIISAEVDK
jgi:hypothetical protein